MPRLDVPQLSDGDLMLRGKRPEDAAAVVAACRDPEIQRWLPAVPRNYTLADYEFWSADTARMAEEGRGISLLVVVSGEVVGAIGLNDVDSRPHIGYWTASHARGQGVAQRALRLLSAWVSSELGIDPVEVLVHPDNTASQRVALGAGFRPTGELRPPRLADVPGRDYIVYSWTPEPSLGSSPSRSKARSTVRHGTPRGTGAIG